MKVKLIKNIDSEGYNISLTIGKEYEVLGIEADSNRILTELDDLNGERSPYLFDPDCFEITNREEPDFWICDIGEDGERYCYPQEWNRVGFFEDYHDGIQAIQEEFWNGLQLYYPEIYAARKE